MNNSTAVPPTTGPTRGTAEAANATERVQQLEAELVRARAEFAALNNRLSHDVQGILRNIASFANYIRDTASDRLSEREVRYLSRIVAGAQRGATVARDLTSLATVATTELRRTTIDPVNLARQTVAELEPVTAGRAVQFGLPEGPVVKAEADLVLARLAIWHLLSNAIKFTRPKSAADIRVTVHTEQESCVISVIDNGVGFSPEYGSKLFAPFERLHYEEEFEGNGIGLAVVKEVAARHGGQAGAELVAGGGARFWLALPLARSVQAPTPSAAPDSEALTRRLVVAIDDEPLVLMTVKTLLERDGNEVITAVGGEEGVRLMRALAADSRKVEVVICDWMMPRVNGGDIARVAKELHPASRVIVLTGLRANVTSDDSMPGAVDDIVGKPVRAADLRRAVQAGAGT